MARSNKPIVWLPFAAGGIVAAFVMPVLILLTILAGLGLVAGVFSYANIHAFAASWFGKLILLGVIVMSLWHAAHRLRITLHDFGVRADNLVAIIVYVLAAIGSVLCLLYLLQI